MNTINKPYINDTDINTQKRKIDEMEESEGYLKPENFCHVNYTTLKTQKEVDEESKLKTQEILIELGKLMNAKEQKDKEQNEELERHAKTVQKYQNLDIIKVVDNFIDDKKKIDMKNIIDTLISNYRITNEIIEDKDEEIKKLNRFLTEETENNKDLFNENDNLTLENDKLETKIENLNKQMKYLHIGYIVGMFHIFVFSKFGFNHYFTIIINVFKTFLFLFNIIPNCIQAIKNPETYVYLKEIINGNNIYVLNFIYEYGFYLIQYLMNFNIFLKISLFIFTLFMILFINKILKKK
jgi:hypothetical protein